jgi:hypothetical protein
LVRRGGAPSREGDAAVSAARAREVLARFGDPREIIEAERPELIVSARRRGTREWTAIFLLLFGFFAAGVGWLVGVVLLWTSRAWTTQDKVIGTLVLPGGLSTSVVLVLLATARAHKQMCLYHAAGLVHCTHVPSDGPSTLGSIGLILLALTPIATGVYLARRAR